MSVESDRTRTDVSVVEEGVSGREGKGEVSRTTFEATDAGAIVIAQSVRSGCETKGQGRSNVRIFRNTSAAPLQVHTDLRAHRDKPDPHSIVRSNVGKCAMPKHAKLSRSASIYCPHKKVFFVFTDLR